MGLLSPSAYPSYTLGHSHPSPHLILCIFPRVRKEEGRRGTSLTSPVVTAVLSLKAWRWVPARGRHPNIGLPLVAKSALLRASFGDSALHSQRGFPKWETSGVGSPPSSHLTIHPTASPVKSLNL